MVDGGSLETWKEMVKEHAKYKCCDDKVLHLKAIDSWVVLRIKELEIEKEELIIRVKELQVSAKELQEEEYIPEIVLELQTVLGKLELLREMNAKDI